MAFARPTLRPALCALAAATLAAAACADGADAPAPAPARPTPAALEGRWASKGCEASPAADGSTTYLRRAFALTRTSWHLDLGVFGDAACSAPLFDVAIDGPYELGGASPTVAGAVEARFGIEKNVWTARTDAMASLFSSSGCGAGAWAVGAPQDVSATGCLGVAHEVDECPAEFDLVAFEGGELFFGARVTDMCREEGRPARLGAYGLEPR